ncbi:MAG: hydroxypyruvate isomerase [Saprospiraceae bacterium]|jgi:hydroxypyruvate isomerase
MKRRSFITNTVLAAPLVACASPSLLSSAVIKETSTNTNAIEPFKLKFGPHLGMFKNLAGKDPIDQLNFMADQGFSAYEDNGMSGRDIALQEKMASTMGNRGLEMGVFVAHKIYWKEPNLASGKEDKRVEFLADITKAVEVARRVNAKWMTVVPGHLDLRQDMGYQTANVIETLKQASAICEPHNITMVLEPLNKRNHPGLFLTEAGQAFQICQAVGSPSCKILFDIYHQQIQEGNLIPNIDASWDEIAYFQIGDNPGRNEPTTGEINYKNVFQHIHDKGSTHVLGMEHGNSVDGAEGEKKLIAAYRSVDLAG